MDVSEGGGRIWGRSVGIDDEGRLACHFYIYSGHFPPGGGGGNFCPNRKTGKNWKEDFMKKRKVKRRKEEK